MSEEMTKIMNDFIAEYEESKLGKKMTEEQKQLFIDAFLLGEEFAENTGTYI